MNEAAQPREVVFEDLRSGLGTDHMLESDPPALALNYLGELRMLLDPPEVRGEFSREELEGFLR